MPSPAFSHSPSGARKGIAASTASGARAARQRVAPPQAPQPQPARPRGACACGGTCARCSARAGKSAAPAGQRESGAEASAAPTGQRSSHPKSSAAPALARKHILGAPGDASEREADAVADRVMRLGDAGPVRSALPEIRRKCAAPPAPALAASTLAASAHDGTRAGAIDTALRAASSAGAPLGADARAFFEPRFGMDFRQVRMHAGPEAAQAAAGIGARAYTIGRDVVLGGGESSVTPAGRRLLAHELTHVAQAGEVGMGGAAPVIRRQPKEPGGDELDTGAATPATIDEKLEPKLTDVPGSVEPTKCPAATNLGNIEPDPPCAVETSQISGDVILFCADSDAFLSQKEADKLRSIGRSQPHGTTFQLQAHSSIEGPGGGAQARKYNENLSCHRVKRAAHVLMDVGVAETDIETTSGGPTDRFGNTEALRHMNRNVLVGKTRPEEAGPADEIKGSLRTQVDAAKQRLVDGHYNIGADGYLMRWTCGRWNSLADAVARMNIRIKGDPGWQQNAEGIAPLKGMNVIDMPDELILEFSNTVECAMARIVDLTFHHLALPHIPLHSERHMGGAHLVSLAGLSGCNKIPAGKPGTTDPFADRQPPCATNADTGPLNTKGLAAGAVPTFFGVMPVPPARSGGFFISGSNSGDAVNADPDDTPMSFSATVTSSGKAKGPSDFEVGFVQTALSDVNVATYMDGRKVLRQLPLPLRDGAPNGDPHHIEAPWFAQGARAAAQPGNTSVSMDDAPNAAAFLRFPDLAKTTFGLRGPKDSELVAPPMHTVKQVPSAKDPTKLVDVLDLGFAHDKPHDIIDRIDRKLEFVTWLVARRHGAALAQDSTQFLSGVRTSLALHPSIVVRPTGPGSFSFGGGGKWTMKATASTPADAGDVRLSGAVPGEFSARFVLGQGGVPLFREFLGTNETVPGRDVNGGLHVNNWRAEVIKIADAHRAGKPGLQNALLVAVKVDMATGRTALDEAAALPGDAVTVKAIAGQPLDAALAKQLAVDIYPEVRKLVVGFVPSLQNKNSGMASLAVTLPAKTGP